jgi:hypothetical protein
MFIAGPARRLLGRSAWLGPIKIYLKGISIIEDTVDKSIVIQTSDAPTPLRLKIFLSAFPSRKSLKALLISLGAALTWFMLQSNSVTAPDL